MEGVVQMNSTISHMAHIPACMSGAVKLLAASLLLGLAPHAGADETVTLSKTERLADVSELQLLNLAGEVRIEKSSGSSLELEASIQATGDTAVEAQQYAESITLETSRHGDTVRVITHYPVEEHDTFVYDPGYRGNYNGSMSYLGERIEVRSRGSGVRLHVDYVIRVPAETKTIVINKVGLVVASDVDGDLDLDTSSGAIQVSGGKGRTGADTGSGSVEVSNRDGDVYADTGSGSVRVENVTGSVEADTGSGSVSLQNVRGSVAIDTGSGGADLVGITGDIHVDTGSGGVEGRDLSGVRELEIDTGSGRVELEGDFSQLEEMMIDTGSGGVSIVTAGTLNMELEIETGSGGSRVELPDMKNVRSGRGEFRATIGNGKGRGHIDTGSGGVRITSR